jgi:tetratricopeptide (TPR) repeat protein
MPRQKSQHVDNPKAVGERLKAAREAKGLSQRQLAFDGCSPAYISRIEAGDRIPSLQLLREMGRRLDVSEDWLATGESEPDKLRFQDAELAYRLDDLDGAEQTYRQLLDESKQPLARASALEGLGQISLRRGATKEAIALLEEALETSGQSACDRPGLAEALGRAYASIGELAPALSLFERCFEDFHRRGDQLQAIRFGALLGYALTDAGNFARAEQVIGKAIADGADVQDPIARARLYWVQSKLRSDQGDPDAAARYAQMALATLEATEHTWFIARAHQGLALVELDRDRPEAALDHLSQGMALIEQVGSKTDRASFRVEEARALARLGHAEAAANVAMSVTAELGDELPEEAGRTYTLLADVYVELGQPERAQELYELAAEYLRPNNPNRYMAEVYSKLAALHESQGRQERAYEYMKLALGMQQAVTARAHA